jgi:hypothetical protein
VSEKRKTRREVIGGREFRVLEIPAVPPPPKRSAKTRYRMADVGKGGPSEQRVRKL